MSNLRRYVVCKGMKLSRIVAIGLTLTARMSVEPVAVASTIRTPSHTAGKDTGSQNMRFCVGYNRRYPSGSTVACMVQPGPNNLCGGLLGLTVKLWTCSNGQWVMK
jgi:hypothetical protein